MDADKPGRDPVKRKVNDTWKLTRGQRSALLEWIGEGLTPREMNKRAAALRRPFKVTRQLVDYYRKTIGAEVLEKRKADDVSALGRGFAKKEERVRVLNRLAEKLERDLLGEDPDAPGLWLEDCKSLGTGEYATLYDFKRFNVAEVQELREVLEHIAREVGDRDKRIRLGAGEKDGPDGEATELKFYIGLDPERI